MERITFDGNFCDIIMCHNEDGSYSCEKGTCDLKRTWERLKEIENILGKNYDLDRLKVLVNQRMTMREEVAERFSITKDIPVDRLRELVEAERAGRCVVLPCKVGDVIYKVSFFKLKVYEVSVGQEFWNGGEFTLFAHPVLENEKLGTCYEVIEQKDFGKTVFLTREAAEAALKGETHEDPV